MGSDHRLRSGYWRGKGPTPLSLFSGYALRSGKRQLELTLIKRFVYGFMIVLSLSLTRTPVLASCLGGDTRATSETIAHAISQSDAVFLGTIVARWDSNHGTLVQFTVERVFKGPAITGPLRPRSGCNAWHWGAEVNERAIYFVYREHHHTNVTMFSDLGSDEKRVEEALRLMNEKR
jgi:hypothetical protein